MTFPLPYTIAHRAYSGTGEDDHGNEIPAYAAPVTVAAFWWSPSSSEPAVAGHDRVVVDKVAVVDSATEIGPRDLVEIEDIEYEVVGYAEDYDHGPWWVPGCRPVNLQRVEG